MSEENYLFTTISYGEKYHEMARNLAEDMAEVGKRFLIFTDNKRYFDGLDNVLLRDYEPHPLNERKISGYDKDRIASKVFEMADCMWYIDADWRLKKGAADLDYLDSITIEAGLTSAQGPMGRIHSSGYPRSCIEWARERYGVDTPRHYGEACYTIKKGPLTEEYLKILLEFGEMSDRIEIANNVERFISKASGVSFGYAQQAAGLKRNSNKQMRKAFYSNFEHLYATTNGIIK
jgi:hypothetical protein